MIDTHLHLIARRRFRYAWADEVPTLACGDFSLSDVTSEAADAIAKYLFMETGLGDSSYQDETRWIFHLMQQEPKLVGQVASCRPETDDGFCAWLEESAELGVVGYRRVLHVAPDDISRTEGFRSNIRRIGVAGKPFEICVLARQLPNAIALVQACPSVLFVLDHCGVPDVASAALYPWRAHLSILAALPNVVCKLSGLTAYARLDLELEPQLRPFVDHVLNTFGPTRLMWGSDWPVVNTGSGLSCWLEITRKLLASLSSDEASAISSQTARRVYGLAEQTPDFHSVSI